MHASAISFEFQFGNLLFLRLIQARSVSQQEQLERLRKKVGYADERRKVEAMSGLTELLFNSTSAEARGGGWRSFQLTLFLPSGQFQAREAPTQKSPVEVTGL